MAAQPEKPRSGWLYIVDSKNGRQEAQVLLVDPSAGRVVKVFNTGMNPDIALSPDGTRLYLASSQVTPEGIASEELAVIDTSTGASLLTVSNSKRVTYNVIPPSSALAISPNGRWLYVMKYEVISNLNTLYWIETFDTVSGKFLPGKADLSGCGWGRLLPLDRNREIQVVCEQSKDVRLLKIDQRGAALVAAAQFAQGNSASAPSVNFERRAGKLQSNLVADSFRSGGSRNITVLRDGRVLSYDAATNALAEVAAPELPANAWIQSIAKAKGNNWLYFGLRVPTLASIETESESEIVSLNVSNFLQAASNKTSQRFHYLYVSRDGRWLYAVNTLDSNLLIIEAATLKEVKELSDLGQTPSLIVESP
jgi:DNA-binding beta-propeller fold protein YncE